MSISPLEKLKKLDLSRAVDDTDVAFHIVDVSGSATATVDIDTDTANSMEIITNGATNTFDLTAAAYDTMGELWDAIEAADKDLKIIPVGAIRSDNTYSTNTKMLAIDKTAAAGNLATNGHLPVYYDSSRALIRCMAVGAAEDTDLPVQARTAEITAPFKRDGSDHSGQSFSAQKTAALLDSLRIAATHTSGTCSIYRSTKKADTLLFTKSLASSASDETWDSDEWGPDGLQCGIGERIVVRVSGSALSSSTLQAHGWILG